MAQLADDAETWLDDAHLDDLLTAIGDFVDLTCPFTLGYSRHVARPARGGRRTARAPGDFVTAVRRAGHLHDVGRIGVSKQVWRSRPGADPDSEPRPRGRDSARHEHLDGSGYPLGLAGTALGRPARLFAAAVAYQSALERPVSRRS